MLAMAVIVAVGGALAWFRLHRNERLRQRVSRAHASLARWAEDNGWRAYEGIDIRYAELVDRITGLMGEPGDWLGRVEDDSLSGDRRWQYGTILVRDMNVGELIVFGCWRIEGISHHVFAALQTDGTFSPYTLDCLRARKFHNQGQPPDIEDFDVESSLTGLPRPARLRFVDNRIMLRTPGDLSPEIAVDMAERISRIHEHLPRRPGLGPMR